jgi:serine phosphatase RsbU (regulator of sigma subunit)
MSQTNYKNTLQREHEYNEQRRKIERQTETWIRYSLIAGVVLALGLVFFALRAFRIKSKAFAIISQQQEELLQNQEEIIAQRNFIEQQNKNLTYQNEQITHSIRTALAIQQALLPFKSRVRAFLKDYFVLYEPRDIVSGDFYWIEKIDHKAVIIVGDCTGHGVPGAFMSLIAINLIERIVLQQEITAPAKILAELHSLVRIALKQDDIENQTGMDVAITVLDLPTDTENRQETILHFAGAKRHLYYIHAQNPTEVGKVAGSRKAIGGLQNEKLEFAEHTLVLPAESIFYMTSDGLPDQNNHQRKRLGETPIFETLLQHYPVLPAQQQGLKMLLETYMQNTYQRDDILLLGVKV